MNQADKKALLHRYRQEQAEQFRASLPMKPELFEALFAQLEEMEDCAGDLRRTIAFLEHREVPREPVIAWLLENGGGCDCEVLDNVQERFEEYAIT